jgi:hypothetical protein
MVAKKTKSVWISKHEMKTPVEMHIMPDLREIIQGHEAEKGQRPMRIELGRGMYMLFKSNLVDTQTLAGEPGQGEIRKLKFMDVPVVSGKFDGIRVVA